jgi:hypothetical protein
MLALAYGLDISLPAAALMGIDEGHALNSLEALADAHLVQTVAPGRYRFP